MEDCRKIIWNRYRCTYSTNSTNGIIVPEGSDLSWSRNSTNLQTGEIRSLIHNTKAIRDTVPQLEYS